MEEQAFDLLKKTIKHGIGTVGNFLQHFTHRPVIITGRRLVEYYPEKEMPLKKTLQGVLVEMPEITDEQYFYSKNQRALILQVSQQDDKGHVYRLYVIIEDIDTKDILSVVQAVNPARLAMDYYLRGKIQLIEQMKLHKQRFLEDVFITNSIRLDKLLSENGIHLTNDRQYAIMLMEFSGEFPISTSEFRAMVLKFSREYQAIDIYPIRWQNIYIAVLTSNFVDSTNKSDNDWTGEVMLERWQQLLEEKYQLQVAIGVGSLYPIAEINKSYKEARIALKFRTIKGETSFVQRIEDLGIFRELFERSSERICTFCRQTLDKLLEYDHDYDSDLQITLRTLLNENFNYKLTAEKLYVHVNTVRYRCDKIAQLLKLDLNDPDTRFNLYAAIRVGYVLKDLNILQPGYVGSVLEKKDSHKQQKASYTVF